MMMTDQIPLDLAPPPLLNGEVPLMPHMVNGDAAQQVNTHADSHAHTCLLFAFSHPCRMNTQMHPLPFDIPVACKSTHQTAMQALLFVVISSHWLLPQVMNSCQAVTVKRSSCNRNKNKHRCMRAHTQGSFSPRDAAFN